MSFIRHGNVIDYLFSIDPSGQYINGYSWSHCDGSRPDNIYDLSGSGQCVQDGPFKPYVNQYIETVRAPIIKAPVRIVGASYTVNGGDFYGHNTSAPHSVFASGIPQARANLGDNPVGALVGGIQAPADFRYDQFECVWRFPYLTMPVVISQVAPNTSGLCVFNASGILYNYMEHAIHPSGTLYLATDAQCIFSRFVNDVRNKNAFLYKCKPYNNIDGTDREYPLYDADVNTILTRMGVTSNAFNFDQVGSGLTNGPEKLLQWQQGEVVNASIDSADVYILSSGYYPIYSGGLSAIINQCNATSDFLNAHGKDLIFTSRPQFNRFIDYDKNWQFNRLAANQNRPVVQFKGQITNKGELLTSGSDPLETFGAAEFHPQLLIPRDTIELSDKISRQDPMLASGMYLDEYLCYIMSRLKATHTFYEQAYRLNPDNVNIDYTTPLKTLSPFPSGNYIQSTPSGQFLINPRFIGYDKNTRLNGLFPDPGYFISIASGVCVEISSPRESVRTLGTSYYNELLTKGKNSIYSFYDWVDKGRATILEINKKRFPHIPELGTGNIRAHLFSKYPTIFNRPSSGQSYSYSPPFSGGPEPITKIEYLTKGTTSILYDEWLEPSGEIGNLTFARDRINTGISGFWYVGPHSLAILDRTIDELIPLQMQNPTTAMLGSMGEALYNATFYGPSGTPSYATNAGTVAIGGATLEFATSGFMSAGPGSGFCQSIPVPASPPITITSLEFCQPPILPLTSAYSNEHDSNISGYNCNYYYTLNTTSGWCSIHPYRSNALLWNYDLKSVVSPSGEILANSSGIQYVDTNFGIFPSGTTCEIKSFKNAYGPSGQLTPSIECNPSSGIPIGLPSGNFSWSAGSFVLGRYAWAARACYMNANICGSGDGLHSPIKQKSHLTCSATSLPYAELRMFVSFDTQTDEDATPTDILTSGTLYSNIYNKSYTTIRSAVADIYNKPTNEIAGVNLIHDWTIPTVYGHAHISSGTTPTRMGSNLTEVLPTTQPNITCEARNAAGTINSLAAHYDGTKFKVDLANILDTQFGRNDFIAIYYNYTQTNTEPSLPSEVDCGNVLHFDTPEANSLVVNGWNEAAAFSNHRFEVSGIIL